MKALFEQFDFSLLDSPDFKEDSVREEIIVPILSKLGYSATRTNKIIRSKSLEHPFVQFGTKSHKVTIIPDYLLQIDNTYKFVLDAKAPGEIITTGKNVEQAYSYATHREIRVNLYGLCNGKELVVFDIYETKPKLHIGIKEVDARWNEIVRVISPLALTNPHVFSFDPDLGMHLKMLGMSSEIESTFMGIWISYLARVSNDLYSISSAIPFDGKRFLATFDFDSSLLENFLSVVPDEKRQKIAAAVSNFPFKFEPQSAAESVNVRAKVSLSDKMVFGKNAPFIPFIVNQFVPKQ